MIEFPASKNEALSAFVDAVRARSRALKLKFQVISCARSVDDKVGLECVTLLLRNRRRDSLQISLGLWEDRWCRFDVRKAAKSGWKFEWFYDGRIAPGRTGFDLVEALECSKQHCWDDKVDHIALEALWSPLLLRGPRA